MKSRRQSRYAPVAEQSASDRFPILPSQEILDILGQYNISMIPKYLSKPNDNVARTVFSSFLDLSYISKDVYSKPSEDLALKESFELVLFVKRCKELFKICGVKFNTLDLLKPNPTDFTRQICAWINYQRFCVTMNFEEKLYSNSVTLLEEATKVATEIEEIKAERKALAEANVEESEEKTRLQSEVSKLIKSGKEDEKTEKQLEKEVTLYSKKINQLKERQEEVKSEIISVSENIELLSKNVVPSPGRIERAEAEGEEELNALLNRKERVERQIKKDKQSRKHIKQAILQEEDILERLSDIQILMDEINHLDREYSEEQEKDLERELKLKALENDKIARQERIQYLEDLMADARIKKKKNIADLTDNLTRKIKLEATCEKETEKDEKRIEELEKLMTERSIKKKEFETKISNKLQEYKENTQLIANEVKDMYNRDF